MSIPGSGYYRAALVFLSFLSLVIVPSAGFAADHDVYDESQLQAALTTAQANEQEDTITIKVAVINVTSTLTYDPIAAEKFNLTITSDVPGGSTLDGGGSSTTLLEIAYYHYPEPDDGVSYNISNLTFQGVNGGDYALYLYPYQADMVIDGCSFLRNNTEYASAYLSSWGQISVLNTVFNDNTNYDDNGALYISAGEAVTVDNCQFTGNSISDSGSGDGAGAFVETYTTVEVTNSIFSGNSVLYEADYGGGGLYIDASESAAVSNNVFQNNIIAGGYGQGGGVYIDTYNGHTDFFDNQVTGNSNEDSDYGGGGLFIYANTVDISNNLISGNTTKYEGGGIYLELGDTANLFNNLITNNSVLSFAFYPDPPPGSYYYGKGGGIYLYGSSINPLTYILTNNTITGNSSTRSGGGLYFDAYGDDSSLALRNNIIWGNHSDIDTGHDLAIDADHDDNGVNSTINLYHNDYADVLENGLYITGATSPYAIMSGNIHADPQFIDAAAGDYHLGPASPCRDNGDNTWVAEIAHDFEGDDRIVNTTVDIGADEFYRSVIPGDINGVDGVTLADAILVLKVISGVDNLGTVLNEAALENNRIELDDALFIMNEVQN